jgi:hypothetical protein
MYVGSIYLVAKQKKVCSQKDANIFYFGFGVRVPTYTYTAYTGSLVTQHTNWELHPSIEQTEQTYLSSYFHCCS